MSRWKSPQAAAKNAEKHRKEKRKNRRMLIGVIALVLTTWTAYFIWVFTVYLPNRQRHHQQHQHRHGSSTNSNTNAALPDRKP